jgi:hypothetical protein
MTAHVVTLPIRMLADCERRRLDEFLAAIEAAHKARAVHNSFDTCPALDSAAARDALDACIEAEDRVLALAMDPNFPTFLRLVLEQLTDIAGEASCA